MKTVDFICPECGSHKTDVTILVDGGDDGCDPWNATMQVHLCAGCHTGIPAHLGERWNNRSIEQAQKEWREIYRDSQPGWDVI
jgi:hypothetical protein